MSRLLYTIKQAKNSRKMPWMNEIKLDKPTIRQAFKSILGVLVHERSPKIVMSRKLAKHFWRSGERNIWGQIWCLVDSLVGRHGWTTVTVSTQNISCCVFNIPKNIHHMHANIPYFTGLFFIYFRLFKQTLQFLLQYMWKMSIQYMVVRFEPKVFRTRVSSHNHKTRAPPYLFDYLLIVYY